MYTDISLKHRAELSLMLLMLGGFEIYYWHQEEKNKEVKTLGKC